MSTTHRFAAVAVLVLAAIPALAAAPPQPPAPAPACTGFADRLRDQGFSAPAANHFGRLLRDDCLADA